MGKRLPHEASMTRTPGKSASSLASAGGRLLLWGARLAWAVTVDGEEIDAKADRPQGLDRVHYLGRDRLGGRAGR